MTAPKTLTMVLGTAPQDGATVAALRLAEEAVERGHAVRVYAYGEGVRVTARGSVTADHAEAVIRRGMTGPGLTWVVDRDATDSHCGAVPQVSGVLAGDPGELWRFVTGADVVLGVSQ